MNQTSRLRGLRHTLRAVAATAIVAGVTTAGPVMVNADVVSPTSDIGFRLIVEGVGAEPVLDTLTLELFTVDDGIDVLPTPAATCTRSDNTIDGGPATGDDFGIEVYDTSGILTASLQDPDASQGCGSGDIPDYTGDGGIVGIVGINRTLALPSFGLESCGIARFPAGDYELAATLPDYGYVVDDIECFPVASFRFLGDQSSTGGTIDERIERDVGQITHGSDEGGEGTTETVCLVNVRYLEQTFSADVVVVDGDLDPTSVIIEVYDQGGTLVDSTVDPEPGVGNASAQFTLPLGDYTFGVSGIDGYRVEVEVSPIAVPTALIDDPSANFSLVQGATVSGRITLTTIAPTAPTLTVDPNVVLPATGPSSATTPTMLMIALGFLVFGGFAVAGTRRR